MVKKNAQEPNNGGPNDVNVLRCGNCLWRSSDACRKLKPGILGLEKKKFLERWAAEMQGIQNVSELRHEIWRFDIASNGEST